MVSLHRLNNPQQAIIAIATAQSNAGLGVLRISGKNLDDLIAKICRQKLEPRHAHYLPFYNTEGEILDRGIALLFPAPHSYTGETVLELQAHGGMVLLHLLLKACLAAGQSIDLRMAQAGEFTERAYLNHKMDLIQAQAVVDVIHANSEQALRSAQRSLEGEFSKKINAFLTKLIHLRMLIEATLDFPEEDIEFIESYQVAKLLANIISALEDTQQQAKQGQILQEGIQVALVGEPNVGKSSLLNALSGSDVAIVSPIAGTTRDRVFSTIQLQGLVLNMVDTAGLRETEDVIEQIGIERTWQAIQSADLILHLHSLDNINNINNLNNINLNNIENPYLEKIKQHAPHIPYINIYNKVDLINNINNNINNNFNNNDETSVYISAKTAQGLDELQDLIFKKVGYIPNQEGIFTARERQLQALNAAHSHLINAQELLNLGKQTPLDLLAEETRLAQQMLEEITGEFTSDDLLGEIFSTFCIGK